MRERITQLLAGCLAALVLVAFSGCGEDKGPVRTIEDKDVKTDPGKPDGAR